MRFVESGSTGSAFKIGLSGSSSTGAFANNLKEFDSLREFFNSATMTGLVDFPFSLLFVAAIWMNDGDSFAILMLQEGMELRTVQELLGHAHISTTQVYNQLARAEITTSV